MAKRRQSRARARAGAGARARRQEGAIFVEALTVIGLIFVCMQCIWWMYEYCLFQHRAQVEARQKAWEVALKGCGDPDPKGPMSSIGGNPSEIGGISDGSGDPPSWFAVITGQEETVSLDLPEEVFGEAAVGSKQKFACNEKGGKAELQLIGGDDSTQYENEAFAETEPPKE